MEYIAKGEDIYVTLGVSHDASPEEIKKAYYKAALRYHPDRCEGNKEEATKMFQKLGFINTILSDPEKRQIYDKTGDLGVASEELDMDKLRMWKEYFDTMFKPVTEADVESFAARYKGSAEEKEDIIKFYKAGDGSMDVIMSSVPLSECSEEDRYRSIVEGLFTTKVLEPTAKWQKTNTPQAIGKRKKAEENERAEFEAQEKKKKKSKSTKGKADSNDIEALRAAILQKHSAGFADVVAKLERVYANEDAEADANEETAGKKPKKVKAKAQKLTEKPAQATKTKQAAKK